MCPRIATLTLNPAVDLACTAASVRPTHKTRTFEERFDPGGGGINVARVVHELGGDALALIFGSGCDMRLSALARSPAGRAVRTYSGGMRRRLDLAASLLGRPSVLFLDEPTTGLDPHSRLTMWEIIRELVGGGTTVLLTTQYLEEADQLADRIAVIDGGRVTAEGTPAELKARVGTAHLRLTVTAGASLARASEVLSSHAAGPVRELPGAGRLEMPVVPHAGLVTGVVRALDAAGIGVDDIALRRPSLDDVFHALTRREGSPGPGLPVPRVPPDGGSPDVGPPAAAPTGERAA